MNTDINYRFSGVSLGSRSWIIFCTSSAENATEDNRLLVRKLGLVKSSLLLAIREHCLEKKS